jgi:hypothetical protein
MQQQELQQTLTAMAGLYDRLLEQQQGEHGMDMQQQQRQPRRQGQPSHGWNQHQSDPRPQQQQWQQQSSHQGWPPPDRQDMPAPFINRPPPRTLPASLQRQVQQWPAQQHGMSASSNDPVSSTAHDATRCTGSTRSSAGQGPTGPPGDVGAGSSTGGAAVERRPQPLGHMQLSQSAQAPKRAGYLSAKAQVAAQKRSKGAAGQAVVVRPPPLPRSGAAEQSSDDDDDFLR